MTSHPDVFSCLLRLIQIKPKIKLNREIPSIPPHPIPTASVCTGCLIKVNSLKTIERKLRRGFAKASVTKRVYGRPLDQKERYDYDLTSKVVEIKVNELEE